MYTRAAFPIGEVHKVTKEEEGPYRCFDCGKPIDKFEDVSVVSRCVDGPSHNEVGGYVYDDVTVHADRRICGEKAR